MYQIKRQWPCLALATVVANTSSTTLMPIMLISNKQVQIKILEKCYIWEISSNKFSIINKLFLHQIKIKLQQRLLVLNMHPVKQFNTNNRPNHSLWKGHQQVPILILQSMDSTHIQLQVWRKTKTIIRLIIWQNKLIV